MSKKILTENTWKAHYIYQQRDENLDIHTYEEIEYYDSCDKAVEAFIEKYNHTDVVRYIALGIFQWDNVDKEWERLYLRMLNSIYEYEMSSKAE